MCLSSPRIYPFAMACWRRPDSRSDGGNTTRNAPSNVVPAGAKTTEGGSCPPVAEGHATVMRRIRLD